MYEESMIPTKSKVDDQENLQTVLTMMKRVGLIMKIQRYSK
jgi:hypothetical protein